MNTTVQIRIPMPLRNYTSGAGEVLVSATTVGEALAALGAAHDGILSRVLSPEGEVRQFVNIFLGSRNVRTLQGLATPVASGDVISIVPAVAGGIGARETRIAQLKAIIRELEPREALALQSKGAALVDVREADEIGQGCPPGAFKFGRGFLELRIEQAVPDINHPVIAMCNSGVRSLFAAEDLQRLGYRNVYSMVGGFTRWKNEGLPVENVPMLDDRARERYSRHLSMPEVGEAGQRRLLDAKVLLIGAGGLGSPAALYLAAAGVGTLGLVDHDVVERSNLQRQIVHGDARVGMPKVLSARLGIEAINPGVKVQCHEVQLSSANVEAIFADYDLVLDGSDNFPTRYLVNDACIRLGIPNVYGAVYRFEGQVSVFWPSSPQRRGPCYRCLYPSPPPPEFAPSCAEAGVLGVLPGVIGLLQATEAIKVLLDLGEPLVGRLLQYDALRASFYEMALQPEPGCPYCSRPDNFPGYVDYEQFCASAIA